jgi:hypothetical protein
VIRRHDRRQPTDDRTAPPRHRELVKQNAPAAPPRPRCKLCGEQIGIYEPLVVHSWQDARRTSFAAEPELLQTDATWYHDECSQRMGTSGAQ